MEGTIALRPITDEDQELLFHLYVSSREVEMAVSDWPELRKEAFLKGQFVIQSDYFRQLFADARYELVLLDGREIGRQYVHYGMKDILIMDLVLFPEYRGRGIGTGLMADILLKAGEQGLPVHVYVESWSRALSLCHRFGFRKMGENGPYWLMEWLPPPA